MARQLIPTKLYKDIATLLKAEGLIPEIPPLKLTKAKKYDNAYGFLNHTTSTKTNKITGWATVTDTVNFICINRNHCPCTQKELSDDSIWKQHNGRFYFHELVDTICHELAHIIDHTHSKAHTELTGKYKELVYDRIVGINDQTIADYCSDCKEA